MIFFMKLFSVFYMEELDEKLCDDEKISGFEDLPNLGYIRRTKRILIK